MRYTIEVQETFYGLVESIQSNIWNTDDLTAATKQLELCLEGFLWIQKSPRLIESKFILWDNEEDSKIYEATYSVNTNSLFDETGHL